MSKKRGKIEGQEALPFFEEIHDTPPPMIGLAVMTEIKRRLKKQNKSREELVDYMTHRRGRALTLAVADTWFCADKADRWPSFPDLILMLEFVNSTEPLSTLAGFLGATVIGPREKMLLEVGQAYLDEQKLHARKDRLDLAVKSIMALDLRGGAER